jgi:cell division protein FtsQ
MAWRRKGKSGGPRRRARPLWRGRLAMAAIILAVAASAGGAGWWVWQSSHLARVAEVAHAQLIDLSAKAGLTVQEILVTGRRNSPREALLAAVQLTRGSPTLAFDPHAAKARVEALPWVRSASVQRLLPNTVVVRLEERQPLALRQNQGKFRLIDERGDTIAVDRLDYFSDLIVVVGEDAPAHAGKLLELIATQPNLRDRVKAAVRVGGRRWNVRLDNDIDVALPEEDPVAAWARLADYERANRILARDVKLLDLRLPDRLIVRRGSQGSQAKGVADKGRDT